MNVVQTRLVLFIVTAVCLIAMPGMAGHSHAGLVQELDYSDSFTVGVNGRQPGGNPPNGAAQYAVENTYGNPAATWTPYSPYDASKDFSFQTPTSDAAYAAISPAPTGNPGATTGFMRPEKGGGSQFLSDYGIAYDLRTDYVVSADAILPGTDRINISSFSNLGDNIASPGALSVFFRADYSGSSHASIDIYAGGLAGTYEVVPKGQLGINDTNWHNLAVRFDQDGKKLWILVDGKLTGMGGAEEPIDLTYDYVGTELAGAPLANYAYSNNVVAIGGAQSFSYDHPWLDNFQVGSPVSAEPLTRVLDTFDTGADPAGVNNELGWPRQLGSDVPTSGLTYTVNGPGTADISGDQLRITAGAGAATTAWLDENWSALADTQYTIGAKMIFQSGQHASAWNAIVLNEVQTNDTALSLDLMFFIRESGYWAVWAGGSQIYDGTITGASQYDVELVVDEVGPTSLFDVIVDGNTLVDNGSFTPGGNARYFGLRYYGYVNDQFSMMDDFTLTVVPEPSTLLLLGLGAAVIPFWWRRRR